MNAADQYLAFNLRMPTRYGEFVVTHIEFLDEKAVEFTHCHACYEIYYVRAGSLKLSFASTLAEVAERQCLIVAPHCYHQVVTDRPVSYFALGFNGEIRHAIKKGDYDHAAFLRLAQAASDDGRQLVIADQYDCMAILEEIDDEIRQRAWAYKLVLGNLCSNLFFLILRNLPAQQFEGKDMQHYPDEDNTALLITKYIAGHFAQALSIDQVAACFHISARHVNRLLEEYYGQTFNDILNAYRLDAAKALLATTNDSLETIAFAIGFASARSLYNLFARYEALSPLEYRKKVGQQL